MSDTPTKENGSNARLIAEQFVQPLPGAFEQYPDTEIRRTLGRAYLDPEAERDALRETAQALITARAEGARIEPWGALIAALERPE